MSNISLESWESARGEKSRRPRGPKPVARGQLLKATAWLDGDFAWHEGALALDARGQINSADQAQIARAGRALDKLEAREVQQSVVAARRQKWRLLRKLGALQALDFDKLCAVSRRRNPAALGRLAPLLVLEALNVELPQSPARALLLAWPHSQNALESVLADEDLPQSARELAAFVIGAALAPIAHLPRHWRGVAASGARLHQELSEFEAPQLLLRAMSANAATATRLVALCQSQAPFAPDCSALQRLEHAHGIARALEIGEQLASLGDVWPEFPDVALCENGKNARLLREARVDWRVARRAWKDECRAILPQLAARDASAIEPFLRLAQAFIGAAGAPLRYDSPKHRAPFVRDVDTLAFAGEATAKLANWTLSLGREIVANTNALSDVTGCLELWREVAEYHLDWALAAGARRRRYHSSERWAGALRDGFNCSRVALSRVMKIGGVALARRAWQHKNHQVWSVHHRDEGECRWPAPASLESWVQMVTELPELEVSPWEWDEFRGQFALPRRRAELAQLLDATRTLAPAVRAQVIAGLVKWSPARAEARAIWPHLAPIVRALAPVLCARETRHLRGTIKTICELCALCHNLNLPAELWGGIALTTLEICDSTLNLAHLETDCFIALRLCCTVPADAILAQFRATLGHALRLPRDDEGYDLENALPGARLTVGRPQLARALRDGLEVAPARALQALEHLAALRKLHQLETLQILESSAPDLDDSWDEIALLSPAIEQLARDYAHFQNLAGEAATPPAGARKILDWPRKWAREIESLQSRVAANMQLDRTFGKSARAFAR